MKRTVSRVLEVSNFQNIGVKERAYLCLNRSLERNEIGGLVILLGVNNSGKSNLIDAIDIYHYLNYIFPEKDTTYLINNET